MVLFHVAALWALQTGLLRRAVEMIVPVADPERDHHAAGAQGGTAAAGPARRSAAQAAGAARKSSAHAPPPPQPLAIADPDARAATRPPAWSTPQPPPPPVAAPVAAAPAPPPPAAKVELPSSDADYLQNPQPVYPPMSKRLGEQGKVVVRVLIGADGTPQKAELKHSSGFDRLDQAALDTVMKWRYVPGKRRRRARRPCGSTCPSISFLSNYRVQHHGFPIRPDQPLDPG